MPILVLMIQVLVSHQAPPVYRLHQEYPDQPRYFPFHDWYTKQEVVKEVAERFLADNGHDLR